MTDNNHPITPPPELVKQWVSLACEYEGNETWIDLATQAARWGADQELEACCDWMDDNFDHCNSDERSYWLRAARRPKPLSLKEQALKELHHLVEGLPEGTLFSDAAILRAIESLPEEQ